MGATRASTEDEHGGLPVPGDVGGGVSKELGSTRNASLSDERYTPPDEGGSHTLLARPGHERDSTSNNQSHKPSSMSDFKLLQKIGKNVTNLSSM